MGSLLELLEILFKELLLLLVKLSLVLLIQECLSHGLGCVADDLASLLLKLD